MKNNVSTRNIVVLVWSCETILHFVYGFDIFQFLFGIKFDFRELLQDQLPIIATVMANFYTFSKVYFFHFVIYALLLCFVDPFTYEHFTNWLIVTFLPFFNACLTFALWIFGICQTFYQKIKTKVQDVFALFYN